MAYLDTILSAAMQGPSDEDKDTLRRLSRIAGSSNYNPLPDATASGPQNYSTPLSATEEPAFQSWLKTNQVPFKDEPKADYDMRGFYKAAQFGDPRATQSLNAGDQQMHFPDTWKTPYHTGFSNESMYAPQTAPRWEGDVLKTAGGRVVSDERPSQPQTPLGGYLGAIGAGTQPIQSASPREETLPSRIPPERAYPPAEDTGYEGFQVPPPSAISQRLNAIAEQEAALKYPGAHDISQKRRYLADLAGVGIGILSKNPMAGIQMAEGIKTQDFRRKFADLERQREAWTPRETEEQKRTSEAANIYKAERTADIGQQRADTGAGTLAEKVISDRRHAEQLAKNEDDINAHRAINENIATGKLILTGTIAEKRNQLARELEKEREIAAQKRTETAGEYSVKAAGARATAAKEPGESQVAAAKGIVEQALETDDPLIRQRLLDSLGTQEKAEAQKTNPELFKHKKILPAEAIPLGKTKTTLDLIDGIRTRIAKRPEILGPILGRIERGEGAIGTQDVDVAGLETDLNNLLLNESGMYGGTRPSIALVRQIKEGGISKVSNMMSQFVGKLDATENAAKINYKNLSGDEYKKKSKYKVEVLGDAPKQ
jgi:hypothetical protein